MDIYVVMDGARVVGASTRLQGAGLIRVDAANRWAYEYLEGAPDLRRGCYNAAYHRMRIENIELQDWED